MASDTQVYASMQYTLYSEEKKNILCKVSTTALAQYIHRRVTIYSITQLWIIITVYTHSCHITLIKLIRSPSNERLNNNWHDHYVCDELMADCGVHARCQCEWVESLPWVLIITSSLFPMPVLSLCCRYFKATPTHTCRSCVKSILHWSLAEYASCHTASTRNTPVSVSSCTGASGKVVVAFIDDMEHNRSHRPPVVMTIVTCWNISHT